MITSVYVVYFTVLRDSNRE